MKYNLLGLTQLVLSSIDGDEVNSINDNVEAQQVAKIIEVVYNNIIARADVTSQYGLFSLTASGSTLLPTVMTMPPSVVNLTWVKYNKKLLTDTDDNYTTITYLPPVDFTELVTSFKVSTGNVLNYSMTVNSFPIQLYATNNSGPSYYTSFDDSTLLFDSYDNTVDSTLQSAKTTCYGEIVNTFTQTDSYIPPLEDHQVQLLVNEAKSLAWAEMKQSENAHAAGEARKQWIHLQATKRTVPEHVPAIDRLPNYGRRGGYRQSADNMIKWMRAGR